MSLDFTFHCPLTNGLHARPAGQLADLANEFASSCSLTNLRNGMVANLKSPLSIIAANVRAGDACRIEVRGSDKDVAFASLRGFVEQHLPKSDDRAEFAPDAKNEALPRALKQAGAICYFGHVVRRGFGQGKIVFVDRLALSSCVTTEVAVDTAYEQQRIRNALSRVRSRLLEMMSVSDLPAQKAVIKAQLSMAGDVSLAGKLAELIAQGRSAGQAVLEAGGFYLNILQQSESWYIRERAVDLQDIQYQLLREICGTELEGTGVELRESSIVVAETLSPQQLLSLNRAWLKALVLENASTTSHVVILARSLGIPTLVAVKDALRLSLPGEEAVVDANRGFLIPRCTTAVRQFYARESALRERRHILTTGHTNPQVTVNGQKMEISANVALAEELSASFAQGADGIGLFRTEMLFVAKESLPDEDQQFAVYAEAARVAASRAVIIRTVDIGGDKVVPQLNLPTESNPFLGYRGVRIYREYRDLVRTQMRAILRASAFGRVQMMIPMVSSLEEVLWVKALLQQVREELKTENVGFDPGMGLGIMIETPSAAFILDALCAELDFFSVGTNDLSQYFFAADRGNDKVADLSCVRHPGFLRLLRQIVDDIHRSGKWVGLCGEMAADIRNLPLLLGLGLDEISVPACEIHALKQSVSRLSASSCHDLLAKAIACRHPGEVDDLLRQNPAETRRPLFSPELVIINDDSRDKEEAIREMVEALYVAGRTDDPQLMEGAIWERETLSSTGLGYGFAIPHCKTDAITADSVGILKLRQPIEWNSLDNKPVQMVILLAVRASQGTGRHLHILSQLARKLVDEEFRTWLLSHQDADTLVAHLSRELGEEQDN